MKRLFKSGILLGWAGIWLLSSCGADTTSARSEVPDTTAGNIIGTWYFKDIDIDIELQVPMFRSQVKSMLKSQLKKQLSGYTLKYLDEENALFIKDADTFRSTYKVENGAVIHKSLEDKGYPIGYTKAQISGNTLTVSVSKEQLDKVMQRIDSTLSVPEEVKNMFQLNSLSYTFEKK